MPYVTFVCDLISYLHFYRMLHLRHRVVVGDRHLDDADHLLVHLHLVYLIYTVMKMVRHLYVVENLHQLMDHQCVVHLDVQQNLDEQNLDVIPPFLDEVLQFPQVVVVGAELRHLLKMDCYLDVVGAEPHPLLKMDYFLDEVRELMVLQVLRCQLHGLLHDLLPHALQLLPY